MLTLKDIRTLQLAVDNMADDGMTDEGIKVLLTLHAKLEVIATRLTKHAPDAGESVASFSIIPAPAESASEADTTPAPAQVM